MSDPRRELATIWNSWLYHHEIEAAKRLAAEGTDEECVQELERLRGLCKSRLQSWRNAQ